MPAPPDPRSPVVAGAATGAPTVRPATAGPGTEDPSDGPLELMAAAATAAAVDAGAPGLAAAADLVMVPRGSWAGSDPAGDLARRVAPGARTLLAELGVLQTTLLSRAAAVVASGRADVVLVCGGEARRGGPRSPAPGAPGPADDAQPDERLAPAGPIISPQEIGAGLVNAPSHYALIENARRMALGLSLEEHLVAISELWARFNEVARTNPRAAFPVARTARELRSDSGDNRMISFPYRKWEVSQWNVDQAAALLVCSTEAARAHGVPGERMVFLHAVAESDHMVPVTERGSLHRSPGFAAAGRAALGAVGAGIDDMAFVDLYSCFPAAVFLQAEELGTGLERQLTVTGGMSFAGGPLNNYVLQAAVEMCSRLRDAPEERGLLTAVSGMVTKQGVAVLGAHPPAGGCRVIDVTEEVERATATVPVVADAAGPGRVLTYTVMYGRPGAERAVALAELADGRRGLAVSTAPDLMAAMVAEDWLGRDVTLDGQGGFRV